MSEPKVVLETERLLLREMSVDRDLAPLAAHFGDPETMRYYPSTYDRDQSREWIERNLRSYAEVGWHTIKGHWGEGLAPEAGLACRDRAFDELGIDFLVCITGYENIP